MKKSILGKIWNDAPLVTKNEELLNIILKNRGLVEHESIQSFLQPSLQDLHDPFAMKGVKEAIFRIKTAFSKKERIVVFGDFDADGITSTVILTEGLKSLGGIVSYRIPDRNLHSHGLKKYFLDDLAKKNVKLVITCDCGINDKEEVDYAKSLGIDIIITDHHEPDEGKYPEKALAIINPKQKKCDYPEKNLSGAGIAFKLISALAEDILDEDEIAEFLEKFLEVCAIGLIADCVSLTNENRILTKFGLEKLKNTKWQGLKKLLESSDVNFENINEEIINYKIAPKLNAASRIGDVLVASQLFLGEDAEHFRRIEILENWNETRQKMTEKALKESFEQINEKNNFQFFFHKDWLPGVLGLICGRQAELLDQPVIAATVRHDGKITASCRAPNGFSIIKALHFSAEYFENFGGHDGAAGFLTMHENIENIKAKLLEYFSKYSRPPKKICVDAFLEPEILNFDLSNFLNFLRPFGEGNPEPIFGFKDASIEKFSLIGKNKNHARININVANKPFEIMAFFCGNILEKIKINQRADFIFTITENIWKDKKRLQLKLVDIYG